MRVVVGVSRRSESKGQTAVLRCAAAAQAPSKAVYDAFARGRARSSSAAHHAVARRRRARGAPHLVAVALLRFDRIVLCVLRSCFEVMCTQRFALRSTAH